MKAICWFGKEDVRVEKVPDPGLLNPQDIILKVTSTAICGSDLHLYGGLIPTLKAGDILGHEFMGEVVEVGNEVRRVSKGDRVVVPFTIACGRCGYCQQSLTSLCDNSNPNADLAEGAYGYSGSGLFGFSHLFGGYAGGQAEYVRVPYGDVGALKIPDGVPDESALFLSDIFPTGFMAAENCNIKPGDTVAVWGCGPVGLFSMKSATMLGAHRVIGIDRLPERLQMARYECGAETLNYEECDDIVEALRQMTSGRGPDACIDAVGMEAHGSSIFAKYEETTQKLKLATDRPVVLREAIQACRKGGTVSIPGVYGGFLDKIPLGAAFAKGLTLKMGQTNVHKYMAPLLEKIQTGEIDPSFVITHEVSLSEGPDAYRTFQEKSDDCVKFVLKP